MTKPEIIFIAGPTAVGKTDAAIHLAQKLNGEIVSCDSMQIYRDVDIATNKPPKEILTAIPHHLIDILSVEEDFDVARYNRLAIEAIEGIRARARLPIVVGGSGLYMQILLDGIFPSGTRKESLRRDLKEQARQYGNQYLFERLKEEDPQAARKIHPNDVRRVVRALEVCQTEKMPISQLQQQRQGLWGRFDIGLFALNRERRELYQRINDRVEAMTWEGLIDEIKRLQHARFSLTAKKIIGVQEILGFLKGEYDLKKAIDMMQVHTRRLAKRQLTWFRREARLDWIEVEQTDSPEDVAGIIMDRMSI